VVSSEGAIEAETVRNLANRALWCKPSPALALDSQHTHLRGA